MAFSVVPKVFDVRWLVFGHRLLSRKADPQGGSIKLETRRWSLASMQPVNYGARTAYSCDADNFFDAVTQPLWNRSSTGPRAAARSNEPS